MRTRNGILLPGIEFKASPPEREDIVLASGQRLFDEPGPEALQPAIAKAVRDT